MPRWLHENKICRTPQVEFKIKIEPHGISYIFEQDGFHWECSQTQLVVTSTDADNNPGAVVSKIIGLLTHTPVQACGNNFRYIISDQELQKSLGKRLLTSLRKDLLDLERDIIDSSIKYSISYSDALIRTEFFHEEDRVVALFFNFHRETQKASVAEKAADKWDSDKKASEELASDILKGCTHV